MIATVKKWVEEIPPKVNDTVTATVHEEKRPQAADQAGETLVYFGAGWDMRALGKKDFNRFKRHLYIDALPQLQHYEDGQAGYAKSKDLPSFIEAISTSLKTYKLAGTPIQNGNQWIFTLLDNPVRVVEYWVNTTVSDALGNPYLRDELRKAKWLHVQGFHPQE